MLGADGMTAAQSRGRLEQFRAKGTVQEDQYFSRIDLVCRRVVSGGGGGGG